MEDIPPRRRGRRVDRPPRHARKFGRRAASVVTLQIANAAVVGSLREKLARKQARATRLLDEIADLNRDKLEIDVPQEVVRIAGLAA